MAKLLKIHLLLYNNAQKILVRSLIIAKAWNYINSQLSTWIRLI